MKSIKQDIVCISMTTWEGDYMKTIVHMMSQLSKNHRVMFVDYPFTWKDLVSAMLGKSKAPWRRMLGLEPRQRRLKTKHGEVYHLTLPPVLPTNWIKNSVIFQKLVGTQAHKVGRTIRKAMKKIGFESPVIINAFNPIIGLNLTGQLNESKLIYYCYDEIRAAEWCGKHGGFMEDQFIQKADEVIVTSDQLYQTKSVLNPNTTLVKNGVDFELFNRAFHTEQGDRKVVGYVGSIDFRLNFDLLDALARNKPGYDFHFVGRITSSGIAGAEKLKKHSNVTFFGAQQPDDIPKSMSKFDLGMIPFAVNEFTKSIYPLKINEYLAAGIPVVSTDFAPLDDFADHVTIAQQTTEFLSGIDSELALDNPERKLARTEIARQNDWSSRAAQVEQLLNESAHA